MATTHLQGHHHHDRYRNDPSELRTLIKIVAGICLLYYLIFSSGWINLHPDLSEASQAAQHAVETSAAKN